jgi:serine/threonine protein kinase
VLIFGDGEATTAKLIDFGYSCFGTSDDQLVQVAHTKPWQAPELGDQFFRFSHARRMDVYSFGMLLCRVFLRESLSDTVSRVGHCSTREEHETLLKRMQRLKSSPEFLNMVLDALDSSLIIPNDGKAVLKPLFEMTLQHDPTLRAPDFSKMVSLLLSTRENRQASVFRTTFRLWLHRRLMIVIETAPRNWTAATSHLTSPMKYSK